MGTGFSCAWCSAVLLDPAHARKHVAEQCKAAPWRKQIEELAATTTRLTEDYQALKRIADAMGETNTRLLLLLRAVVDRDTTRSADGTVTNCLRCDTIVADGPKSRPHGKTWNGKPCDVGDLTAALLTSDNRALRNPPAEGTVDGGYDAGPAKDDR